MSNQQDRNAITEKLLELLKCMELHDLLQQYHENNGSIIIIILFDNEANTEQSS